MNNTMSQTSLKATLESIVIQFFEMVPIRRIQWQGENVASKDLDVETQRYMLSRTVGSDLCVKYPPSFTYQRAFLKKLLSTLETFNVEICDELYEAYTDLLQQRDRDDESLCYKTYTLDSSNRVTIQESVNMISFGTTGLSTWQAAQHLAEWGLQNKHLLEKKNVVELGCGLGLTGLAMCKTCYVKTYTFTDCNTQVLGLLAKNIAINFCENQCTKRTLNEILESSNMESAQQSVSNHGDCTNKSQCDKCDCVTNKNCDCEKNSDSDMKTLEPVNDIQTMDTRVTGASCYHGDNDNDDDTDCKNPVNEDTDPRLSICKTCEHLRLGILDWENPDRTLVKRLSNTDAILAADVVYDTSIIPALVSVLRLFLSQSLHANAYIASTIRNEDTRDAFLIALSSEGLTYEQMDSPSTQLFHYDRSVPIEILKVTATL